MEAQDGAECHLCKVIHGVMETYGAVECQDKQDIHGVTATPGVEECRNKEAHGAEERHGVEKDHGQCTTTTNEINIPRGLFTALFVIKKHVKEIEKTKLEFRNVLQIA